MTIFKGFPEGKTRLVPVPGSFFQQLLPAIDHLAELQVTLQAFWLLDQLEGQFRYLRKDDFLANAGFMQALGPNPETVLEDTLRRAVQRGTLLRAEIPLEDTPQVLYFLNSPKGRAAVQAIARGEWRPAGELRQPVEVRPEAPNVFRLYEEHIGPLTPMLADALRDAEQTFPAEWVVDAFRIAVEKNKRNWRYILAILNRWQKDGRDERKDRQGTEKTGRSYVEGEYADFIEH